MPEGRERAGGGYESEVSSRVQSSLLARLLRPYIMSAAPKEEDINVIFDSFRPQIDSHIAKWLPRSFTQESMVELCGPAHYAYDLQSATNALLVPIWDILDRGTFFISSAESP